MSLVAMRRLVPALSFLALACGGGASSSLGNDSVSTIDALITQANAYRPVDSTPSPDASVVYFIGKNEAGAHAVLRVPATGGAAALVSSSALLRAPRGLAVSPDGATLYVADAEAAAGGADMGRIHVLAASGGEPTALLGSEGRAPRGVTVSAAGVVYFTGRSGGAAGVFSLPAAGAQAATTLFSGAPLVSPDAIALGASDAVYVTDRGSGEASGLVFRFAGGAATMLASGLRLGAPGGLAATLDGRVVLVSALAADGTDRVELLDTVSGARGTVTKGVSANTAAGGVHRALSQDVFSWCGVTSGGDGQVYRIGLR